MSDAPEAHYVFRVRFRLDPPGAGVRVAPDTFETTLYRRADPPGEPGWRFFRDNLWRGEVNDAAHLRALASDALGVPVEDVSFSELRTTPAYREALEATVEASLPEFRQDSVAAVLSAYLGSSIHVVDPGETRPP